MKKIAYIELDTHAEIAQNFIELMQDSSRFETDYYFSEKIFNQLNRNGENIYVVDDRTLLKQLSEKNYDLVIIGTAHRYFNLFKKITQLFNTSIIVHNQNFTKLTKSQLFKNIFKKDFTYRLKLLLKEGLLSAPQVFRSARNMLVLDEGLAGGNFVALPIFYFKEYPEVKKEGIMVVIPGSVSQQRRDYSGVLDKLKTFRSETPITVYFLGKAQDDELRWLQQFDKKKQANLNIVYFTEKVSTDKFERVMQQADLLWCPIQQKTEFFSNTEIYGKTKLSGNVGDAIRYGKAAIFPREYPSNHQFILSEKEDIEEQIIGFGVDQQFSFREEYNIQKVRSELENVLLKLI